MTETDPAQEWRRLAELYAGMSDEELQELAADPAALTETARQVLRIEMARRGIVPASEAAPAVAEEAEAPGDGELRDPGNMVAISSFTGRDALQEALLAKGSLESAGIECMLFDDNIVRLEPLAPNVFGGVKLLVKPQDADAASDLLDQLDQPGQPPVEESPDDEEPGGGDIIRPQ